MTKAKYSNGAYKTTTPSQDKFSQLVFKFMPGVKYMSMNFNQSNGHCQYTYKLEGQEHEWWTIVLDRRGFVIKADHVEKFEVI